MENLIMLYEEEGVNKYLESDNIEAILKYALDLELQGFEILEFSPDSNELSKHIFAPKYTELPDKRIQFEFEKV